MVAVSLPSNEGTDHGISRYDDHPRSGGNTGRRGRRRRGREAAHSRELQARGHLLRLWRPPLQPVEWRSLGLFAADDDAQLEGVLASMPLRVWRTDAVTPLSPHPNDPALAPKAGNGGVPDHLRGQHSGGHARTRR
jgi:muconolactone delta-isomerase